MMAERKGRTAEAHGEVHLRDYWRTLWDGRWTVAIVFLIVLGVTAAWTFLQTPIYRATSSVEVQPQARRLGPGQDVSGLGVASYGWFAEERYQNTQIEIIKSRDVADRAFQTLGLAKDPRFAGKSDPLAIFIGRFKVEPRRETGLIEISIEGSDRHECAQWANSVADAYVNRNLQRARDNTKNALDQIKKLIEPLKEDLRLVEKEKFDVLKDQEIYSPQNQQEVVRQRLLKLSDELNSAMSRSSQLRSLLKAIEDLQTSGADPDTVPTLAQDEQLQELMRQRISAERDFEAAKVNYKPGHPVYQEKLSQLEKIKSRIRDQIYTVFQQKQTEYAVTQRTQTDLERQIAETQNFAYRVDVATSKYKVADTDVQSKQQMYATVAKTLNEVALGADLLANNVSVLDYAIPPVAPVKPRKMINLFMGCFMGVFLGFGSVFFLDYLNNTLRSPEDIERYLGLTTLAVVPKFDPASISRAAREAYQTLRTSLIFSSMNRERRVVLITSTAPQEGKSSTVAQLARTLAGAGDRVLVIDCDLRRPTLHLHLKLDRDNGLTNFLAAPRGDGDWASYLKTVGPANLQAMTCGPIPPNPPELLGSDRFERLIAEAKALYDWVLVDSPPTVSLSDANVLAGRADMVVLVVRHNKTDRHHVSRSVLQLEQVGAEIAGCILNSVDLDRGSKSDYYYAGYYYDTDEDKRGKGKKERSEAPVS